MPLLSFACLSDTSSFFLQLSIPEAKQDPTSLVKSVYWLESALHFEGGVKGSASSALLKNIGLAHVNLIQNKLLPQDAALPARPFDDVLGTLEHIGWPTSAKYVQSVFLFVCILSFIDNSFFSCFIRHDVN